MKLCILFFLSIITFTYAQPGDVLAMQRKQLEEVEKALQNNPNDMSLVWKRLELVFSPHFDLYQKGETYEGFTYSRVSYPYYILNDLNYLIENNISIKVGNGNISLANYYHKRGQFFYMTGHPEYALNDYLSALEQHPRFRLKQQICIAIAAYYYNLEENYSLENYEKALYYIDLVTPKETLNKPLIYEKYSSRNGDYFQKEKIQLLKATQKTERLVTYLKCIAKSHLYFYEAERKKSEAYQKSHSYTIPYSLRLGYQKLYEIAVHYYEIGNYEKAKKTIEKVIAFLPRNNNGYYYESFAFGDYFLFLSKIYRTKQYQNSVLEIDNLLEGLGDIMQGFPSEAPEQLHRLNELIQQYPYEPKLHLAKAIYLRKIKYNGSFTKAEGNSLELLRQSEALGLQDYRIPYLKAFLLRDEKQYKEALIEINKAQKLYPEHTNIHTIKLNLLHSIASDFETEIADTKSLREASKVIKEIDISLLMKTIDEM